MAVTATLVVGIAAASAPHDEAPAATEGIWSVDGGDVVVGRTGRAASRTQDRVGLYGEPEAELDEPDVAATQGGEREPGSPLTAALVSASEALECASRHLATETRTSPEVRAEVVEAATLVRELIARAEAPDEAPGMPETAEQVDMVLATAVIDLDGVEDDQQVLTQAIATTAARLQELMDSAEVAAVAVTPRPLTAADILRQQIADGRADADRLSGYRNATTGFQNGRIPARVMTPLSWAPGHRLRPDAAAQLERLNTAFRAQFGTNIQVTDSYRSFEGQVAARARVGTMAATPGTSNHGWGVAVDLGTRINSFGTPQHRWMRETAPSFGWILPTWARENGSNPEPWHWEFEGVPRG